MKDPSGCFLAQPSNCWMSLVQSGPGVIFRSPPFESRCRDDDPVSALPQAFATRRPFHRCPFETKEVQSMPVSNLTLVERIARVLAGRYHSINADGDDPSAGP